MPNYKAMYELMARQANQALRLLREARVDQIYQAIDLLQNAQRDAEQLYMQACTTVPFVALQATPPAATGGEGE